MAKSKRKPNGDERRGRLRSTRVSGDTRETLEGTMRELAENLVPGEKNTPLARARVGLDHSLWIAGRRPEAIEHLRDMLRLNPGDNQGARYILAGFLLFLDRDDEVVQLLAQYPDDESAAWAYSRALLSFRHSGDT